MEGKNVVAPEHMVPKIRAAADARIDSDFVIMARTDVLAVHGIEDAIERGNLYREGGADLILVEAPRTIDEMRAITADIHSPIRVWICFRKPCLSTAQRANKTQGNKAEFLAYKGQD